MKTDPYKIIGFSSTLYRKNGAKAPSFLTGFTLVEIMIILGMIGLLIAIAIPSFNNARLQTRKSICINNMRQINSGKEQWALEYGKSTEDTPTENEVGLYIRSGFPRCPSNGTYSVGDLGELPSCSEHGIYPYPMEP